MSKRFAWLLGVVVLVSIGLLVACGSNYNSSSDGLVLVGSQGSGLIETFSFNLGSGSVQNVSNSPADTASQTCVLNGIPTSLVMDPKGAYAYAIINARFFDVGQYHWHFDVQGEFQRDDDGGREPVPFTKATVTIPGAAPPDNTTTADVVPSTMVMDSAGKFLFVADRATTDPAGRLDIPGSVSVFAIGSGGSVTEVAGSPFFPTSAVPPTTLPQSGLDIIAVAATPTVFPAIGINGVQNSVCSTQTPPTSQYLYAVDGIGNQVFEFVVTTTGALQSFSPITPLPTDPLPDRHRRGSVQQIRLCQ